MTGTGPQPGDRPRRLDELARQELIVPIRSSSGEPPDPASVTVEAMRHGTDADGGRFLAAFSSPEVFAEFGPPGSDHVSLAARDLFERADAAQERVVIDAGAPTQVDLSVAVLPFLAAGIDPNSPEAMRARRPIGELPPLEAPEEIPEPFASEARRALEALPQVERAWILRAGTGWTAGIQMHPDAVLGDFDAVRNVLHGVAAEHLGSRRELAVTDLRAPSLRDQYDAVAAPFWVVPRARPKGFLARLLGSD
ncbi:MAG: SseB family protein [Candidatus Limnocylindria bacterium]